MDRSMIIKKIQFILFDHYDEDISVLNAKYFGGFYNDLSEQELLEMYEELKHESENLQYK
tara:strand:+ start:67 stop:246 length:180 start_codon:yes stop_codon:yes gene_type:complete